MSIAKNKPDCKKEENCLFISESTFQSNDTQETNSKEEQRAKWSSDLDFLLSAISYAGKDYNNLSDGKEVQGKWLSFNKIILL